MLNAIIENCVQIVASLLLMLIGVAGTWLTAKIGKRVELSNISLAMDELFSAVSDTVAELQQTLVEGMKAAAADHKLSQDEIDILTIKLRNGALKRLSPAAIGVLNAAGVDISAMIKGMGERAVLNLKK